ncbi:MAG: TSUP family transporter [Chromatocurvus sp.]
MDYLIICTTALAVSALTLFSGFGLGTVLLPAFALFFPLPVAVAATAVVHLANNLFKLALVGRAADWSVVLRFGVPAAVAALAGAGALVGVAGLDAVAEYELFGRTLEVTPLKLTIGLLIIVFAALQLSPAFAALAVPPRYLPVGGMLSGFFGGLTGNQGAFRSAFLIKAGLDKTAFVATGVVSAVIVDSVRLTVYGASYVSTRFEHLPKDVLGLVIAATLAAFLGAFVGTRLLEKVTLSTVQFIVAVGMIGIGSGLVAGWL